MTQKDFNSVTQIGLLCNMEIREFIIILLISIIYGLYSTAYANNNTAIYKYVGEDGHITYANKPLKGGKRLSTTSSSSPKYSHQNTSHESFPKVSVQTQKKRDLKRRQILENELAAETNLLIKARQALFKIQENSVRHTTSASHSAQEVTHHQENLKKLYEDILLHERNIVALKKELANL